jgi:chromosome segregation ATPase
LNSTNAQLQKALGDQARGANQSLAVTNIISNLNNQLNSAQEAVNNANQVLASDQAQLATNQGNLGPAQAAITTAQTAYNRTLQNVQAARQRIGNCE